MAMDCFEYRFKPRSQVLSEKSDQMAEVLKAKQLPANPPITHYEGPETLSKVIKETFGF